MSAYLYTWNPTKWNWKDFQYAVYCMNNDEPYDRRWSCGNTKRIEIGDLFFLMRLGVEPKGIIGCGYVLSIPYKEVHWDQKKKAKGKAILYTDLFFSTLSENPIFPIEFLQDRFSDYNWTPQASGISVPDKIASELLSTIQNDEKFTFLQKSKKEIRLYAEGKERTVSYRTYDRSSIAREVCIKHYGYNCSICGFNFETTFGDLGKNYIEVHHLKQIADIGEEYEINPIEDLRPVCANCHRMLHKRKPVLSIEELRDIRIGRAPDAQKCRPH